MSDPVAKTPPNPPAAPPGPGDNDDHVVERRSLRDYYIILRERLWIALPLALLVSVGLGYKQSRQTPIYIASATMQFEKPERVVTAEGVIDPSIKGEIDMNTNIQVLNSASLRTKVIESFTPEDIAILQKPYLKNLPPGSAPPPPGAMLGSVSAGAVPHSFLIVITVRHQDPRAAALVANRYVDQFMKRMRESLSGANEDAVVLLKQNAERFKNESEIATRKLQKYMEDTKVVSLENSTNTVDTRLRTVDAQLTSARLRRIELQSQIAQIESYERDGKNLLEIAVIANRQDVGTLKSQLDELNRAQSNLAERYLERHPTMIKIASQIAITEEQLEQTIKLAIADLRTSLQKAIETEKTLTDEYDAQVEESLKLRKLAVEYKTLEQEATSIKKTYQDTMDRLNSVTTTQAIEKIPLRILDRAVPPGGPSEPDISRIIKSCIGLGVLVFVGVAVGLSFIDDRVKSAWDVEHFIGVNLLGIIPDLAAMKDDDKYNLVLNNNQAPGVESFLSVYSSVKIHSKLDFPKSVLITSTIPGEGKTLISCNLAGSFARHGKRTLLVDCDLRRPMLHRHFKQQNNLGLITWFENGASLDGDLVSDANLGIITVGENLSLLCSGGRSKSPTEILESQAFGQLIERLKRKYDLVVIDSPPLGAVTDSLLIAERTDEVIYVCRFNRAYRKHIRLYMKALRSGKNEILGVVLNGLSPRRIEYYSNYRYYRSYKKYYGAQT
jgi:succinoglycan biosynthesis transport protein ExoP